MKEDTREASVHLSEKFFKIEPKFRMLIFAVLTTMNVLINMDHGTIPAASNEIKRDLQVNDAQLGTFGSLVYLGNLIGALFLIKLIDIWDRKLLAVLTTCLNAICLYTFTKLDYIWFLFINRVIVGMMQSFITIYFPVWIDQFGPKSWKTVMMSVFNITSPLGVVLGYVMTMLIKNELNVRVNYYF